MLDIAKEILIYDPWAIKYYDDIVKIMPGKVLTKNLNVISKDKNFYSLINFNSLSETEKKELINLCDTKIDNFLKSPRGKKAFQHRSRSSGKIYWWFN